MVSPLLWRASQRYLWRHPWQLILAVLGVALGVAVVVAVDLANSSSSRAFRLSMDEISGRATHQILGGPSGLDEQVYTRLRVEARVRASAPIVEAFARVDSETVRLLGIDPFAEEVFRGHLEDTGDTSIRQLLTIPNSVLMAAVTAARLGLKSGDRLTLNLGGRGHLVRLVGLLNAGEQSAALDGLVIADIATAQGLTGQIGKLSWIDLIIPERQTDALRQRITALLPPDAELVPAESRTEAMAQMVQAFHTNLSAMSLLALIVGMFLIYNTMTFAVLQRRELIGALRALGVTRREVFQLVLTEAAIIGLTGSLLGLIAGILLGYGLIHLVTRTINDLYFVLTATNVSVMPTSILKGAVLGLGATLLATLPPAFEAAWTAPKTVLRRSELEARVRDLVPRLALLGLLFALVAVALLSLSSRDLVLGFIALFLLILGLTLVCPQLVASLVDLLMLLVRRAFGVQVRLGLRGINAALSRTGVAIAALMLAVSTTVGVGVMIKSFRAAVALWLGSTLQADVYVAAPSFRSTRTQSRFDPELIKRIRAVPGVADIGTGRSVTVESANSLTEVFTVELARGRDPTYMLKQGDPGAVWKAFKASEAVLVSEPFAFRRNVGVGDQIDLRTDAGPRSFQVAGVYYDYDSGPGVVLMNRVLYNRYWRDRAVDALGIYLQVDADATKVMDAIRARLDPTQEIQVRSNREIRELSLEIFDRTFTITQVLRLLAVLVAFVGILSALMALQLERARELAILRAVGFTPHQISAMVTLQSGFMGLVAGLLSIPAGLILAQVLIHVINRRAFGWSMQFQIDTVVLGQAVLLAVVSAVIAGLYPAWKMARTTPAAILREE